MIFIMSASRRRSSLQVAVIVVCLFSLLFVSQIQNNIIQTSDTSLHSTININALAKKVHHLSMSLTDLWCSTRHIGYSGGFCLTSDSVFQGGNHVWDPTLCLELEKIFGYSSVVDLGAGLGPYGRCLLRRKEKVFNLKEEEKSNKLNEMFLYQMGAMINTSKVVYSWDGFDAAGNVELLSKGFLKQQDLTEDDLWLGRKWDWVMSLEVGEHIPNNFETIFIDNLVKHGCKGIVLSWAYPGQGGHKHVNEQPEQYIKDKIMSYGLWNDMEAEARLRNTTELYYFAKTLMVFRYKKPKICTIYNN